MKKYIFGSFIVMAIALMFSAGYTYSARSSNSFVKSDDGQQVCPNTDGWTKVESSDFEEMPGAVEYCFKAGPYVVYDYPDGGFGQSGGCSEENIEQCGLSHWSYRTLACPMPGSGDVSSYDFGLHQIVDGDLLPGSDDVYSLADGNYLQCFCGLDGQGIQTFFWRTDEAQHDGWVSLNGEQWNLGDLNYLAKNTLYDCSE